jgi:phage baseplate assembly protein W
MAIKQTNIFPIDQEPRNAVGLAYPFSAFATTGYIDGDIPQWTALNASTPFKLNYTTREQINSNLIIWFTTSQNERPLNPNYGGGLKNILFDNLTNQTFDLVEKKIKDDLTIYFPEVDLKNLEVMEDIDNNLLKVVMSYTVFNNNEDSLELNFSL